MAESEGFEPSIGDKPYTPLAGARLQPLGQLSKRKILYAKNLKFKQTVWIGVLKAVVVSEFDRTWIATAKILYSKSNFAPVTFNFHFFL